MSLGNWFRARKRVSALERENSDLRRELRELRRQNDSMRDGMRRCVTCEYRLDYRQEASAPVSGAER